jgi:hypothetical protein
MLKKFKNDMNSCYPIGMKIDGTKSSSDIQKKKDAKKASSGDGAFKSLMESGANATKETSGSALTSGIANIDVLLAAQGAEDPAQKKTNQRMKARAEDILAQLDNLKMAMTSGGVTIGHMVSIADVVATHRENITDPDLASILDEIDLRAHVELAKLEVAKSKI